MVHAGIAIELLCSRFVSRHKRWGSLSCFVPDDPDGAWTLMMSMIVKGLYDVLIGIILPIEITIDGVQQREV